MASDSWPKSSDSRVVTDVQYEQVSSYANYEGFTNAFPVPIDDPPAYADATGLAVKMRAGTTATVRGHGYATGTTDVTISVTSNSAGSTRIDLLVLRLDRSTWEINEAIITGTPGSPSAPSPVRNISATGYYDFPVAKISVASGASSILATDVTIVGWFLEQTGTILCTSTSRPPESPGRKIWESDTGNFYEGIGSNSWRLAGEDTGWTTAGIGNNTTQWDVALPPEVRRINGQILVRGGAFTHKGALNGSTSQRLFSLPAGFQDPNTFHYFPAYATTGGSALIGVYPTNAGSNRAGQVWIVGHLNLASGDGIYLPTMPITPS